MSDSAEPPRTSAAKSRIGRVVAAALLAACIGGALGGGFGLALSKLRPPRYVGTVTVRAAVADGSCVYFSCPPAEAGNTGIGYVLDQATHITSLSMARAVRRTLKNDSPSASHLLANVQAAEVGVSSSVAISFTSPSAREAANVGAAYGNAYVAWSSSQSARSVRAVAEALQGQLKSAEGQGLTASQVAETQSTILKLRAAAVLFASGQGPDAATDRGLQPSGVVVKRNGLAALRSALVGTFVGSGAGLLLLVLLLRSRPWRGRSGHPSGSGAVMRTAEPLDPVSG